ncbi:hypothetical protein IFM89_031535 [Coptis chinensis]|uniref:Photosystem I assembly protein Ycf4 n=1 Tax=Coptis chinensis TaxID=261450 RepID=A0A835IFE4_9MAGN|nr:hypothetical protein IFM89_031535 [Coptis chinensis]
MSGSERIELLIDPGTWDAMDEDMVSVDPIEFHSEEEPYKDHIDSYKISSALYHYQSNKKLFYVALILTSPTTGGVTASFGMLGDIIIAEPNAYIAFAGKRVIEQTLNKTVPDGSQEAKYLFHKGLFDPIVPRNLLKGVLGSLGFLLVGISSYLGRNLISLFPSQQFSTRDRDVFLWDRRNRRIFLRFLMRDIQSIRIEVKEGIYPRRVLYMEIRGQGAIPLTRTDENLTPREIEKRAAELAYFLRVPIEVF